MAPEPVVLMPAEEVDADPVDNAALERRWDLLTRQSAQVEPARDVVVTCPCGRPVRFIDAFRCRVCSILFCARCALRHFGLRRGEDGRVVRAETTTQGGCAG